MATPLILFLSRKAIEEQLPQLQEFLNVVPVAMAIAQTDADKDAALKLTPVVATFNQITAIVADFPACVAVNDDGSISPILLEEPQPEAQAPLIELVG
jgi:hypothetical protein